MRFIKLKISHLSFIDIQCKELRLLKKNIKVTVNLLILWGMIEF